MIRELMPGEFFQGDPQVVSSSKEVMRQLRNYRDQTVPSDLVVRVTEVMLQQGQYPSLIEPAKVLQENLQDPRSIARYGHLCSIQSQPIKVLFGDLGTDVAAFDDRGSAIVTEAIELNKIDGSGAVKFHGIDAQTSDLSITLNRDLIRAGATDAVLLFMIAKEASHILYFKAAKEALLAELRQLYHLPDDPALEDILVTSAMHSGDPRFNYPHVSPLFNTFPWRIDCAGFGHMACDIGQAFTEGKLSLKDQQALSINLRIFNRAKDSNVIVKDPTRKNGYKFKEGVTPFSQPWFEVVDRVIRR